MKEWGRKFFLETEGILILHTSSNLILWYCTTNAFFWLIVCIQNLVWITCCYLGQLSLKNERIFGLVYKSKSVCAQNNLFPSHGIVIFSSSLTSAKINRCSSLSMAYIIHQWYGRTYRNIRREISNTLSREFKKMILDIRRLISMNILFSYFFSVSL